MKIIFKKPHPHLPGANELIHSGDVFPCSAVEVGQHWYWFLTISWPETILTYHQLDHLEQISIDFESKCNDFQLRKIHFPVFNMLTILLKPPSVCWLIHNSLWPSDTIGHHRTRSTLAPLHYLKQVCQFQWGTVKIQALFKLLRTLSNDQWGPVTLTWGQFLKDPSCQLIKLAKKLPTYFFFQMSQGSVH